jgi:hypothetical protein
MQPQAVVPPLGVARPRVTTVVVVIGKEEEPWEIIYFKLNKSRLPLVEQTLEADSSNARPMYRCGEGFGSAAHPPSA